MSSRRLLLLFLAGVCSIQAQFVDSISPAYVNQRNCPLAILGRSVNGENLYKSLFVGNASDRTILRAQFGWVVSDKEHPEKRVVITGNLVDLNLPASGTRDVASDSVSLSATNEILLQIGAKRGEITLGVVYVRFADEGEWSFPLAAKGAFAATDDSEIKQNFADALRDRIQGKASSASGNKLDSCLDPGR